jgi:hypothetical protein
LLGEQLSLLVVWSPSDIVYKLKGNKMKKAYKKGQILSLIITFLTIQPWEIAQYKPEWVKLPRCFRIIYVTRKLELLT